MPHGQLETESQQNQSPVLHKLKGDNQQSPKYTHTTGISFAMLVNLHSSKTE